MRADSAVEPTKSENITVTWRRSARSSGEALGAPGAIFRSLEGPGALVSLRRAAMASRSLRRWPSAVTPSSLRFLRRQVWEDRLVYLILAEYRLIPSEAQAPQPDHNVHDGAPNSGLLHIIMRSGECV